MKRVVLGPVLFVITTVMACANSASLGTLSETEAGAPPSFTPTETDGGTTDAPVVPLLCVATDCIAPFETCPSSRWRCDTNLDNDAKNCGGCGIACPPDPSSGALNMTFSCAAGKCVSQCTSTVDFGTVVRYADCNGVIDDGCEVRIGSKQNCGSCGDTCAPGLECVNFQCGCRAPLVKAGDTCVCPAGTATCTTPWGSQECVDTTTADQNCGACGTRCTTSTGPDPNTYYGCLGSTCNTLKCNSGWFDCDGNKQNGCESQINTDAKNCGACGNACAAGKQCFRGECVCAAGTFCGGTCIDLETDPQSCGRCDAKCPGMTRSDAGFWNLPSPNGAPSCLGGRCDYTCDSGWADCDQDIENGCESDILTNPFRCGGCNIKCDVEAGQVCSRGKCAMRQCEEGEVR